MLVKHGDGWRYLVYWPDVERQRVIPPEERAKVCGVDSGPVTDATWARFIDALDNLRIFDATDIVTRLNARGYAGPRRYDAGVPRETSPEDAS